MAEYQVRYRYNDSYGNEKDDYSRVETDRGYSTLSEARWAANAIIESGGSHVEWVDVETVLTRRVYVRGAK